MKKHILEKILFIDLGGHILSSLHKELYQAIQNAKTSLEDAKKWGISKANAERVYRIAKAQKIATDKANGVQVTIIQDLAKGDENIASLCYERDVAEVMYKASVESVNVYKKEAEIIKDEIKREWGKDD